MNAASPPHGTSVASRKNISSEFATIYFVPARLKGDRQDNDLRWAMQHSDKTNSVGLCPGTSLQEDCTQQGAEKEQGILMSETFPTWCVRRPAF